MKVIIKDEPFKLKDLPDSGMFLADLIGYWFDGRLIVLKNRHGTQDGMKPEQLAEFLNANR